ncbi:hypothetical protein ACFOWE_11390 [Planomonospora corallina]|uniref:Tryptophan-associated transmembrane protein (Trp_oprn_chp) n=1 Tax=Planomonospora corallina TaxID=1806052 RepID=A0ABV8I8Y6_9ACTN
MRHVYGLLVGLVTTAVLLLGAGWAVAETGFVLQPGGAAPAPAADASRTWVVLGVMAGIGLLLGLVAAGRVSPLAAFVPSVTLLAWTVAYALDAGRALDFVPDTPSFHELLLQAGRGMRTLLTTGLYAMLGVALFLPVLMPSRWAGSGRSEDDEYEEADEESYWSAKED